ncbi:hypothetical protein K7G82_21990 [Sphingomonas colocasiae]|uniref:Uncharacterized protein n=2 Tax=Sphingomonas colocasiae TaxID=1848973 RepID=A0ABS7PUF8_9SPHN|nr:hypothetical protein [Sphingomonas colocasiae]
MKMIIISGPHGAFIAELRRIRRSSWLLVAACAVFQLGDAAIHSAPSTAPIPHQEGLS